MHTHQAYIRSTPLTSKCMLRFSSSLYKVGSSMVWYPCPILSAFSTSTACEVQIKIHIENYIPNKRNKERTGSLHSIQTVVFFYQPTRESRSQSWQQTIAVPGLEPRPPCPIHCHVIHFSGFKKESWERAAVGNSWKHFLPETLHCNTYAKKSLPRFDKQTIIVMWSHFEDHLWKLKSSRYHSFAGN